MTAAEKIINDCVSPFNEQQRQKLQDLSKVCKEYSAVPNAALEAYIAQLRDLYPEMFHTDKTLKHRVFFDEPRSATSCARFVRAKVQSPYRIVPVRA